MTIENARRFIKQVASDQGIRDRLNTANTPGELQAILKQIGFEFSPMEMEQAHQNLLTNSQSAEEAALVNEIRGWWEFLNATVQR